MSEVKEKYTVEIADVQLSILSDEREDFVKAVVDKLDREVRDMTVHSKRCSKLDAALLCALDYCAENIKIEKRVRNLETQIALYDANMRRMREEMSDLKAKCGEDALTEKAARAEEAKAEEPKAEEPARREEAPGEKLRQLELILRGIKTEEPAPAAASVEEEPQQVEIPAPGIL